MINKVLIIAGMHRSGTSLVTQWLSRLGLHVGDNLLGKGIGNDDGHYEDLDFYNFHLNLLRSNNLPDSGFLESPFTGMTANEQIGAAKLISLKNDRHAEWAWKDPRTCLFLPDYNLLLPEAVYLVVYRGFQQTASSLLVRLQKVIESNINKDKKRGFFARLFHGRTRKREMDELCRQYAPHYLKVWMMYNRSILRFLDSIKPEKYVVISYASLISADHSIFAFLKNRWQFSLNFIPFRDVYKPALISSEINISRYVDRTLLEEAQKIEALLAQKAFKTQDKSPRNTTSMLN